MNRKELCLVAASGGLDSSLTLSVLRMSGYDNIVACHFNYGHRGGKAEQLAIQNVCKELDISLKVFDLIDLYKQLDTASMLTNVNAKITTGTVAGLKQLDAWTNCRNLMFMTIMAAFAESQVMEHEYDKVYFLGGFLNLSESGHYPDNSEAFLDACLNVFKYGTLIGNRIEPLYCLSNLMKSELFVLIKEFGLEDVYHHTISCDRPIVDEHGNARNCSKNGLPACGSGLLSLWGSRMVGMNDMSMRLFYEVDDPNYQPHIPQHLKDQFSKTPDINDIIDRILLPKDKIENLKQILRDRKNDRI